MTGRERLIKTFKGQKVDRVAICPWIYKNMVYRYFDISPKDQKWRQCDNIAEKAVEVSDYFGFDFLHRLGTPWHVYDEKSSNGKWIVNVDFKSKNGSDTEITTIKTPQKKLTQIKEFKQTSRYTYIEAIKEHYIKDRDDFGQFLKYQPPFVDAIYPALIDEFNNLGKAKKALGNKGVVVSCAFGGAFNNLNMYRKLEDIMMDPLSDIGLYKAMIEYFCRRSFEMYEKMVQHGADVIEIGANLATSGVGAKFFENYVLDYEKQLIDKIHSLGAFDLYHNCGDADKIMHLYNNLGTNAWGYITPPPFGDVDIDKALKTINKNIVLIGNIDQVEFIIKATPVQVKGKVRQLLEKVKPRGNFILSTTDWFFDNTPFENIKAFVEAGVEYGKYTKK